MCTFHISIWIQIARAYFHKPIQFDANQRRMEREKRKRRMTINRCFLYFVFWISTHVERLAGRKLIALHSNYRFVLSFCLPSLLRLAQLSSALKWFILVFRLDLAILLIGKLNAMLDTHIHMVFSSVLQSQVWWVFYALSRKLIVA